MSLESIKEMFASQLDPDVVQLVFEQSGQNAEMALEGLFTMMAESNSSEKPAEARLWPQDQQQFTSKMHLSRNLSNDNFPNVGLSAYKDIYRSNEDLYHDDTPNGMQFNIASNTNPSREPSELDDFSELSEPVTKASTEVPNKTIHINGVSPSSSTRAPGSYPGPLHSTRQSTSQFPGSYGAQPQHRWPPNQYKEASPYTPRATPKLLGDYIPPYSSNGVQPSGDSKMILDLVSRIKSGERILILMRGCSGSGKSTLARRLKHSGVLLSTDDYFIDVKRNTYNFDVRCLSEAHQWNQNRARRSMELKRSPVIIDNTNIEAWEMKPYVAMAVQFMYSVELVEPETPWRYRVGQLFTRSTHNVPRKTIEAALDRFDHNITAAQLVRSIVESNARSSAQDVMVESNEGLSTLSKSTDDMASHKEVNGDKSNVIPFDSPDVVQASDGEINFVGEMQGKVMNNSNDVHLMNNMRKTIPFQSTRGSFEISASSREHPSKLPSSPPIMNSFGSPWDMVNVAKPAGNNYPVPGPGPPRTEISQEIANLGRELDGISLNELRDKYGIMNLKHVDKETAVPNPLTRSYDLEKNDSIESKMASNSRQAKTTRLACAFQKHDDHSEHLLSSVASQVPQKPLASTPTSNAPEMQANHSEFFVSKNMEVEEEIDWHPLMEVQSSQKTSGQDKMVTEKTSNKKPGNDGVASAFDIKKLFPAVPVDHIEDLLKNCANDVQWAVNILLDGGYSMEPQEIPEDECEEALDEAIAPADSSTVPETSQGASSEATIPIKPNLRQFSSNVSKVNGLQVVDSDVVLQLDRVTALKLQELFGPVLYNLPPDSYEKDDLQVKISSEVAFAIHQCWIDSLAERFDNTAAEMQAIINDEQHAMQLQFGASGTSPTQQCFKNDGTSGYTSNFELMPKLQPEDVPERLSDIMALDAAFQESKLKANVKTKDNLATRMKRSRLYEMFPMVDRKALEEVFQAHNYSFPDTAKAVQITFEPERKAQTTYTDDYLRKMEEDVLSKAIQQSLLDMEQVRIPPIEDEETLYRTIENPTYDDLRAEAQIHYRLHHECLQKAQEANKRQYTAVAAHYSRLGLLHYEKVKEAHRLAKQKTLEMKNVNNDPLKLDLHMLHVKEAVDALDEFLTEKHSELVKGPKRKVEVYVITGRGIHSPGGVGKIKQAVKKFLLSNKYKFTEINPGLIQVTVSRNSGS